MTTNWVPTIPDERQLLDAVLRLRPVGWPVMGQLNLAVAVVYEVACLALERSSQPDTAAL